MKQAIVVFCGVCSRNTPMIHPLLWGFPVCYFEVHTEEREKMIVIDSRYGTFLVSESLREN